MFFCTACLVHSSEVKTQRKYTDKQNDSDRLGIPGDLFPLDFHINILHPNCYTFGI